ncbi:sortase, partial [Candidatus Daviesbacteria bacterium]|nr:sortase [Candidatus Daviesbacteria bacterium]
MIKSVKVTSVIFLGLGVFVLMQAILPLVSFKVWEWMNLQNNAPLITPYSTNSQIAGVSVAKADFPAFISTNSRKVKPNYDSFAISIPKLDISQAIVAVDSNDLDTHLALLPGTALPGEKGNVFISGHSSGFNPQLSDKTYLTIFKDLQKLQRGDEIKVLVMGQTFTYKVTGMMVVDPKNLSVINPPDLNGRFIPLMTCV